MGKSRELCKWKKGEYEKSLDKLKEIVSSPKFVCVRCGRAAKDKKNLCKPEDL